MLLFYFFGKIFSNIKCYININGFMDFYFKIFLVLISNTVNSGKYNPYKQNSQSVSIKEPGDQNISELLP